MNFRLTAALLIAVVFLVGGLLVAVLVDDRPAADAVLLAALAGVKEDEIDTLELLRTEPTEQKLIFVRVDKTRWELREPATAKVESFAVSNLVSELLRLKPTPFADIPGSAGDAGLASPSLKVTLRKGEKYATLLVGETAGPKEKAVAFAATADRPASIVAVKRSDLEALFKPGSGSGRAAESAKWLTDYRQKRLLGADLGDAVSALKSLAVAKGKQQLALARSDAGDWTFTAPASYGAADVAGDPEAKPDAFTGVRPLLTALTGLQAFANEDFIEQPKPLAEYGLDEANAIRIELTPKNGSPEILLLGKKVDEKATPVKVYAKVAGDSCVVKVQTDKLDAVLKALADPAELRDRSLVAELKKERIDAMDVVAGGTTFKLRKVLLPAGREWVLYGGPTDPQIAAPAAKELIDALTKPRAAAAVLTAPDDAAFAAPERKAEIKIWYDGTTPGKKDDKAAADALPPEPTVKPTPNVTLLFGKRDGATIFTRRTGEPTTTDFKVPEAIFTAANRSRLAYLTPKLPGFATNAVTKVVLTRGGETFELTKDAKPDPAYPVGKWTFVKPDRLKGQIADAEKVGSGTTFGGAGLAGVLATLSAEGVMSEAPIDADLTQFGLKPAAVTATVTLDVPADKERTFEFGNGTPEKGYTYARVGGGKLVFKVLTAVADQVAKADFRDLTLYKIDPAKVQTISFRGWRPAAGGPPAEYSFKRDGAGWATVKSPAPFAADPAKLNLLANILASPKPLSGTGGGQKPEHGFDVANSPNALEVRLEVDGHPPIALTLGATADSGAGVYCWCITRKDEVVVLPAFGLRSFQEKAEYLKK